MRAILLWVCCVTQDVANEVTPPMADPARADRVDIYAVSMILRRRPNYLAVQPRRGTQTIRLHQVPKDSSLCPSQSIRPTGRSSGRLRARSLKPAPPTPVRQRIVYTCPVRTRLIDSTNIDERCCDVQKSVKQRELTGD